MKMMFTYMTCALLLTPIFDIKASFPEEEERLRTSTPKTESCQHRYLLEKYVFVGLDKERDVALFRRINNETFYERLKNIMPRLLRGIIFKK